MIGASLLVLRGFAGDCGVIAVAVFKAAMAAGLLQPWLRDAPRRVALHRQSRRLVGLSLLGGTLRFVLSAFAAAGVGCALYLRIDQRGGGRCALAATPGMQPWSNTAGRVERL